MRSNLSSGGINAHDASPYRVEARGANARRAAALVLRQYVLRMYRSGIDQLPDRYI
jgi:hypothetical protein